MPKTMIPPEPDHPQRTPSDVPFGTVIRRGLARRCPACGKGTTLSGYLTRVPRCTACNLDLSEIRADDGPAWATLIVVGHVLAPLMVILGRDEKGAGLGRHPPAVGGDAGRCGLDVAAREGAVHCADLAHRCHR
jgi:hypothetical protein